MRRGNWIVVLGLGLMVGVLGQANVALAQENATLTITGEDDIGDRHDGYYYPTPQTVEHYSSRVVTLEDSDKIRRLGFVIGMARQLVSSEYAPDYAIFAKGDTGQKLIITGLRDGSLDTIYRARALFASLTLIARSTPFFQKNTQPEEATFFDLLKLLGFTQVTISDGKQFCHQVIID